MENKKIIQSYINNFRRHLAQYLKPSIGLSCKIYPAKADGAILEFTIKPDINNEDIFEKSEDTVNSILKIIPQRMVGGNLGAVKFSGTNISMEPNRIVLIKGEDEKNLWSDEAAKEDVKKIIGVHGRAQK